MIDRGFGWGGLIAGCLALTSPALGGEDREGLLETARNGNRAAIASITSMACRYERILWANTSLEQAKSRFRLCPPGRFWRSGDVYRLFEPHESEELTSHYVARNGQRLSLGVFKDATHSRPNVALTTISPANGVGGEMWQYLLFSHWGNKVVSFLPFHDILQEPHTVHAVERLPPSRNEIHVELSHAGGRLGFWFDPKVNYLVRKSVMVPAQGPTCRWENEVIAFSELVPSVFVPSTIEHRCLVDGKPEAVIRTVLSEMKVNQPLAEDALRLPGIAGMECMDFIRRVSYTVNADGSRAGPESAFKTPDGHPSDFMPESSEPDPPWWAYVLSTSAGVLLLAITLAILRRLARTAEG